MQNISPNSQGPLPSLNSANPSTVPATQNANILIQDSHPARHLFSNQSSPISSPFTAQSIRLSPGQEETSALPGHLEANVQPNAPSTIPSIARTIRILSEKVFENGTAVLNAVKAGSLHDLESYANLGCRFDNLYEDPSSGARNYNFLHLAASHGQSQLFPFFLSKGLDINSLSSNMRTPLHCAIASGRTPEVIKKLLKAGADPNIADADQKTPLELAIRTRNPTYIEPLLLSDRFDPKKNFNHSLVQAFIEAPVYLFYGFLDCIEETSLSKEKELAKIEAFHELFVRSLIYQIGKDLRQFSFINEENSKKISKLLYTYLRSPYAKPHSVDREGNNFLHNFVLSFGSLFFSDVCQYIKSHFSDAPERFKELIERKNSAGDTIFSIYLEKLIEQNRIPSLKEWKDLSELGFNVLSFNKEGNNFLHLFAKRKEFYNLAGQLLDQGVLDKEKLAFLLCQKNKNGETPYAIAKKYNTHIDFLKTLFSSTPGFKSLIYICIQYGLNEALSDLVQRKKQILSPDAFQNWIDANHERTAFLFQCLNYKNLEALKTLLSAGAKWEICDEDYRSLAYLMLKRDFTSGLLELIELAISQKKEYEAFSQLGINNKHLIFDAIRLAKYDLVPFLYYKTKGYRVKDPELGTPIHKLCYYPECFHILEKILKKNNIEFSRETFLEMIQESSLINNFLSPIELATMRGNFKAAALLFNYGAKFPPRIISLYKSTYFQKPLDPYSGLFARAFLTQLTGSKLQDAVDPKEMVDYDSLPGAVSFPFLLTSKAETSKAKIDEQNYQQYVGKYFKQIGQILTAIEESVFDSIGAQKFGPGVKQKIENALLHIYNHTRKRIIYSNNEDILGFDYQVRQQCIEMVACLSDLGDALEKVADPKARAQILLEIATPEIENSCIGNTRKEVLFAWHRLKQSERENLSGFRNHLETLLRDVLYTQVGLFVKKISTQDDPGIPNKAKNPKELAHLHNQLLYLLGLTSVAELKDTYPFSDNEIMGKFILYLGESDQWLIDPFLSMVKKKNLEEEMTLNIKDFIKKELNQNPEFVQKRKQVQEFSQEADNKRFDAISKELGDKKKADEVIALFQEYRSANLEPSVLVCTIKQRLEKPSSGKRGREEYLTQAETFRHSKRIRTQEEAVNLGHSFEMDEKWKKILAAEIQWQTSVSEFAKRENISYSPDDSLESLLFETAKSKRLHSLVDETGNITTKKAARYLLKHLDVLQNE